MEDEQYWIAVGQDESDTAKALFYHETMVDQAATDREGHVVTRNVERVKILVPGDDKSVVDRVVTDKDKKRWPEVYQRFHERRDRQVIDGTDIREWPYLTRDWVAKLQFLNVHTIEEIAKAPDSLLEKMGPGARDLQARAKVFLKPATAKESSWHKERKAMEQRISQLESQLRQPKKEQEAA